MHTTYKKVFLTFFTLIIIAFSLQAFGVNNITDYRPEIKPYVDFLQQHAENPVDYILSLYNTHDIVILAERDHQETTQWDLIYKLVSDPRFYSQVGSIFTEYDSVTQQSDMNAFLNSPTLDTSKALKLMRDQPIWPEGRDDNNYYDFLLKFYKLDQNLNSAQKIAIYPSDIPWQWDNITPQFYQSYDQYQDSQGQLQLSPDSYSRDRRMALRIYLKYLDIEKGTDPRKKILVIVNTRHAYGYMKILDQPPMAFIGQNVGGYLFSWLPGKVSNVLINWYALDQNHDPVPVANGKWDAAFTVLGDQPIAFNLKDSPFGEEFFSTKYNIKYQDMFTGMVFYTPLNKQMVDNDIPDFYSEDFIPTLKDRCLLVSEDYWKGEQLELEKRKLYPALYGLRRLIDEPGYQDIMKQINYWLTPKNK